MLAASRGSSPPYSKLRPLRGSRSRLIPPASRTLKPLRRASLPNHPAAGVRNFRIPAGRRGEIGRQRRAQAGICPGLARHSRPGIRLQECRNAEPGDAADKACRLLQSCRGLLEILPRRIAREIPEQQRELLVSSHGLEQDPCARVRIESGIHPRLVGLQFGRPGRSAGERRHKSGERGSNCSTQFESLRPGSVRARRTRAADGAVSAIRHQGGSSGTKLDRSGTKLDRN
jgi:hypothetical protein